MFPIGMLLTLAGGAAVTPPQAADTACIVMTPNQDPADRPSPLDSVTIRLDGGIVKICYGRPSSRGRTMVGGDAVPYGRLWRTGANEPTMIHTTVPISVAGVAVEPGTYSLYTVPGEDEWEIIVNRSISQWGHESRYTDQVRAQEVGRGTVSAGSTDGHVETFTIRAEGSGASTALILEWEGTRVRIPVARG